MIDNLGAALRALKERAASPDNAPVLAADVLTTQFHGLNLDQLVKLIDAPALGTVMLLRTPQGATVARYLVDGVDPNRRSALMRQLLLDDEIQNGAGLREVLEFEAGSLRNRMMRGQDNVIYRVEGGQVVVDDALTAELGSRLAPITRSTMGEPDRGAPFQPRPLVIEDALAFSGAAGEVLQGLAALHASNKQATAALRAMVGATAAIDAAPGNIGTSAIDAVASAIAQIEQQIAALQRQVTMLLRLVDQAKPLAVASTVSRAFAEPIHQ